MPTIAIFVSGSGSNAENIINYFKDSTIKVALIATNNPEAYALERAKKLEIPSYVFNRKQFYETDEVLVQLKDHKIDFIVLAGFLWLVPQNLLSKYPNKIINIHPALLPLYGGKGMYGTKVHEAVKLAGETQTGITIHYVNENYDKGNTIFQAICSVEEIDTPDTIANKVHQLEYEHFPKVIEKIILLNN